MSEIRRIRTIWLGAWQGLPLTARRWLWFVGLWLASVATIGAVAYAIRLALKT